MAIQKVDPAEVAALLAQPGATSASVAQVLGVHRSTISRLAQKIESGQLDHLSYEADETDPDDEIPTVIRSYQDQPNHKVYPLGDVHMGGLRHNAARWQEWLSYLEGTDNVSMALTGDLFNAALKDSLSEAYDERMTVGQALKVLRVQLTPLAKQGKIDIVVDGNHEDRIYRAVGWAPLETLAEMLEIPYARSSAMLVYRINDVEYLGYLRHGTGSGQSLAQLTKSQLVAHADFYITGHLHRQSVTTDDVYVYNPVTERVERRRQTFVASGSFLGYEEYAAKRGYQAGRIGAPRIWLDGSHRDVHVSI